MKYCYNIVLIFIFAPNFSWINFDAKVFLLNILGNIFTCKTAGELRIYVLGTVAIIHHYLK